MGSFGVWHVLILAVVALVLFGRGKVSDLMGDVGRGINSFKKGLNEKEAPRAIEMEAAGEKTEPLNQS